ncbi:MAG: putative quinone oxidoreductase [Ilumatobacteraceae bacterium]|nr:putative quinone oxidoreductase [Ilumatobacteraceae bacterium]MCU1386788.1 putative quinone oxidoreductase [Ilumatobacteraceae bacterium]
MRAVVLRTHTGPDSLVIEDVADPVVGPDEVLVDIRSAALNRADMLQTMGFYPDPRGTTPEIPGMEFSGVVASVGTRVRSWKAGDAVMAIDAGGAYAERIAVHERQLMPVPASIALEDAAAIPEVYLTAWDALVVQGGLTSGRWALVHAGGSGVGTASILIAKAIGARIVVTCSAGKVAACLALGADAVIDYGTQDFVAETMDVTGGVGADVILDVIGGDYVDRNIRSVATQGRIIQVGLMGGGATEVNVGMLLGKRAGIIGTTLRGRPLEQKAALTQRFVREMLPLFDSGALRPIIDSRFPLDRIADAHRYMATNANTGKILVDVRV